MTEEQRVSVAREFLLRLDKDEDILELFDDDALYYFPKRGLMRGKQEISEFLVQLGKFISVIKHDADRFNIVTQGSLVVIEGASSGVTADGVEWVAGRTHAGNWCDVFDIQDFKIRRLSTYLDPDYAGADTARYPWLQTESR
ncbi:nuclear transport factor 2 family protein [Nocardia sp.]|uniref:nuclear transport factor 2 family protein n=1 Tax=Nocardia sp. TaxID=1821 RepID=UPI00260A6D3C|nr:nuclear transport factor 2 family protein [Nocardia sp.]